MTDSTLRLGWSCDHIRCRDLWNWWACRRRFTANASQGIRSNLWDVFVAWRRPDSGQDPYASDSFSAPFLCDEDEEGMCHHYL